MRTYQQGPTTPGVTNFSGKKLEVILGQPQGWSVLHVFPFKGIWLIKARAEKRVIKWPPCITYPSCQSWRIFATRKHRYNIDKYIYIYIIIYSSYTCIELKKSRVYVCIHLNTFVFKWMSVEHRLHFFECRVDVPKTMPFLSATSLVTLPHELMWANDKINALAHAELPWIPSVLERLQIFHKCGQDFSTTINCLYICDEKATNKRQSASLQSLKPFQLILHIYIRATNGLRDVRAKLMDACSLASLLASCGL